MESVLREHQRLEKSANLDKSVKNVDHIIQELKEARRAVETDSSVAAMVLAKLHGPMKKSFDHINDDFQDIHRGLRGYSKAMDKKVKDIKSVPLGDSETLSAQSGLINRAIVMHLLREGQFDVAGTFITEANTRGPSSAAEAATSLSGTVPVAMDQDNDTPITNHNADIAPGAATTVPPDPPSTMSFDPRSTDTPAPWAEPTPAQPDALGPSTSSTPLPANATPPLNKPPSNTHPPESLKAQFAEMYDILHALRTYADLGPAIAWTRVHSAALESRGSTLGFDLCRLHYIGLFTSSLPSEGPLAAVAYARNMFTHFPPRYAGQVWELLGALAFTPALRRSPYAGLFRTRKDDPDTLNAAAAAFTSDFCSLLSLSSASPLLTAVTAGCIALPTLQKFREIQQEHRTSWTTAAELPVEVLLPPGFSFHSVFVCPVSKEQSTDANPPMMMPCGHVLARGSLEQLGRGGGSGGSAGGPGGKFKCPYCPVESGVADAMRVYL